MATEVRIEEWSVERCPHVDPYRAPELDDHIHLAGRIGEKVKLTSRVVAAKGRTVTTKSGSVYRLGRVAPHYREWLAEHGLTYDASQPVKVRP